MTQMKPPPENPGRFNLRTGAIVRSLFASLFEESGRIDDKFLCQSFNRVERGRICCAFKQADIVAVEPSTMRQFLLRKPTGVTHSP